MHFQFRQTVVDNVCVLLISLFRVTHLSNTSNELRILCSIFLVNTDICTLFLNCSSRLFKLDLWTGPFREWINFFSGFVIPFRWKRMIVPTFNVSSLLHLPLNFSSKFPEKQKDTVNNFRFHFKPPIWTNNPNYNLAGWKSTWLNTIHHFNGHHINLKYVITVKGGDVSTNHKSSIIIELSELGQPLFDI